MFIELLKLKKEAEVLDTGGMIKEANIKDSKIKRISNFLSNLHNLNLPDYIIDRLILARKNYDRYLMKNSASDNIDTYEKQWDSVLDYDADSDGDDDFGDEVEPLDDDDDDFTIKKNLSDKKGTGVIDFYSSMIGSILGGTSDKRYFLDLKPSQITDKNGVLSMSSRMDNPEGYAIYLIANPEKQQDPGNEGFIEKLGGDFSEISQKQAQDILEYFAKGDLNRRSFPGMCLDLFSQLLLKAGERDVDDPIIDKLTPELARYELYGYDPESQGEDDKSFSGSGGRMAAVYNYYKSDSSGTARNINTVKEALERFWKLHSEDINNYFQEGKFIDIASYMFANANANVRAEETHGGKLKRVYPNVKPLEKALFGGDMYGLEILKKLKEIASRFGETIDSNTINIPDSIANVLRKTWDFSSFEGSPFSSISNQKTIQNKFIQNDMKLRLIREVIAEEREKKNQDRPYIKFFTENDEVLVIREINGLGMLLRFEEYFLKLKNKEELSKAMASLVKKVKYNKKMIEDGNLDKRESTKEDEETISRCSGNYYTVSINPDNGELDLIPDNLARLKDLTKLRKKSIRMAGENLSNEGGKEEMKEFSVDVAIDIALKYTSHITQSSMDQTSQGAEGEGEGRSRHEQVADTSGMNPAEFAMFEEEKGDKKWQIEKQIGLNDKLDAKARAILGYLARSKRKLPSDLGFSEAYESGVETKKSFYLSVIKDMILRSSIAREDETDKMSEGSISDEEWIAKIEKTYGNKITDYIINDDGTTTVIFEGEDGETVINEHPKTTEELVELTRKEEKESGRGQESRVKAVKWMKKFQQETVVEKVNMFAFNMEDMDNKKENPRQKQIAKSVIMDDKFHDEFAKILRENNSDWSFDQGIALKEKINGLSGKAQTEKTFKLGRCCAYLYFVCGLDPNQMGAISLEAEMTRHLGAYIATIQKFYETYRSDESGFEIGESLDAIRVPEKIKNIYKKDKDGKYIYETDERGKKVRSIDSVQVTKNYDRKKEVAPIYGSISNANGVLDVDNVVLLFSDYLDYSTTLRQSYGIGTARSLGLGYSEQRTKAFYTMRIKQIMDAMRFGNIGRKELNSLFASSQRNDNTVLSASTATGQFSAIKDNFIVALRRTMSNFYKSVEGFEEGEEVKKKARDYLQKISNICDKFNDNLSKNQQLFNNICRLDENMYDYLNSLKVDGKPINPVSGENALDIYEDYMKYIEYRYGENSEQPDRKFVSKLVSDYNLLDKVDSPNIDFSTSGNFVEMADEFVSEYSKAEEILERYIETGLKELDEEENNESNENSIANEISKEIDQEVEEPAIEETIVEEPVAENILLEDPIQEQKMETFDNIQSLDTKMEHAREMQKQYLGRDIQVNSTEYNELLGLGFKFEGFDDQDPNSVLISDFPDGYKKYWYQRVMRERMEKRQSMAISELKGYVIFGEKEIDYIIKKYGV